METLELKAKNYCPGSISFADGFMGPRGDVGFFMTADWDKAKSIIEKILSSGRNIEEVEMGLDGDWDCNSMTVWKDGQFTEYDCYGTSQWAEPIIIVKYEDAPSEAYPVWKRENK